MKDIKIRDEDLIFYDLRQGTISINLDPNFMTINFFKDGLDQDVDESKSFISGNVIVRTTDESKEAVTNFMKEVAKANTKIIDQSKALRTLVENGLEVSVSPSLRKLISQ